MMSACNHHEGALAFKSISYVTSFPVRCEVHDSEQVHLDVQGVIDFRLTDSLLLLSQSGQNKILRTFSYPSMAPLGDYIGLGNGPGEQLFPFYFCNTAVKANCDGIRLTVPSFNKKIVDYCIPLTPNGSELVLNEYALALDQNALGLYALDDSTVFYQSLSVDRLHLNRHIRINGVEQVVPSHSVLDEAAINSTDGYSFNILSVIPVFNSHSGIVAECCLSFNCINLYSIKDPSFNKSIVIGKHLATVAEAEQTMLEIGMLPQCCYYAVPFDDCFAVLFREPETESQSVLLFDWSGNAVKRIELPGTATSFDIDFDHNVLITWNSEKEEMFFHRF